MIPIATSTGSQQMLHSPTVPGIQSPPTTTMALSGSSNEISRQSLHGQIVTPFFQQTLNQSVNTPFITPALSADDATALSPRVGAASSPSASAASIFVPMATTVQESTEHDALEAYRGSVEVLQDELIARQCREVSLLETKAIPVTQKTISELERELADTKSKENSLKDKLRDLRQEEIQDLKEQLAFHAMINERSRQMQSLRVSGLFLAGKTSMFAAEIFQAWRRVTTEAAREKLEQKLQSKLDMIRNATVKVFAGRSDSSSLTYIFQAWIKYVSEERARKREKEIKAHAMALKMQTLASAKRLLVAMTQMSDTETSRLHFYQWRLFTFGICRQEKTIVKAQEDTVAWRNRVDKVRNVHLRAVVKWMGHSKAHIVIVVWKRAVEDAKSQRTAAEYQNEVAKLKTVSIPLMTSVIQTECAKRWKAISSARLTKTINTHANAHFRGKDEITLIRTFNSWKHFQKNTKYETLLADNKAATRRQSQNFDAQMIETRSSMNSAIDARAEEHRLALQNETDRAQEALTGISRLHEDKMKTIKRQYQQQMAQAAEASRKELHQAIYKLDEEMRQVKERGFEAEDKLKQQHREQIAKMRDEHLQLKEQLVERCKKEQQANAASLNKRLSESSEASRLLDLKAQKLNEESQITIAERDAAQKELEMYQIEFRNLLREFAQYRSRADELEQVQKDDVAALEHFIGNNIPAGPKFLLGRPIQIGDTKISKGHVVPMQQQIGLVNLGSVQSLRPNANAVTPLSVSNPAPSFLQNRVPVHLCPVSVSSPRIDTKISQPPMMSSTQMTSLQQMISPRM